MNKRHVLLLTAVLGMACASAQTPAPATSQSAGTVIKNAVADPSLVDAPITVNTGSYVGPLSTLLSVIARSARYEVVFDFNVDALALINGDIVRPNSGVSSSNAAPSNTNAPLNYSTPLGKPAELPAKPVAYNFVNKPFNQIWPLLMDVYDLQYEIVKVGSGQVLRISQRPQQLAIPIQYLDVKTVIDMAKEFFGEPNYTDRSETDPVTKVTTVTRYKDGYSLPDTLKIIPDVVNKRIIVRATNDDTLKVRSFVSTIDIPTQAGASTTENRIVYDVKSSPVAINNLLQSQYPDLKVIPVGQTQQLIITGPQFQLTSAIDLLNKVDKASLPKDATVQQVFQLVNASAEELKATLEGTLARTVTSQNLTANATLIDPLTGQPYTNGPLANAPLNQPQAGAASSPTSAAGAGAATPASTDLAVSSSPATIIADKRTNTLIVRGTQVQVDQIAQLIPQLDKVVPQINVQVRIQEITQEASRSLGLDWTANFGGFKVSVGGTTGLGATFDPTRSLVGFNIFPTLNALETQSLAKKVYDGSITMQSGQRSLDSSGATQNDSAGAAASVKSGGRLELNIPSTAANVPAIQKEIDYGVNLDFFNPQVAPDGTITLRVRGQVNDLNTALPSNGVGVPNILDFSNSEAQSLVTFKSGQTLLLTGLMGNKSRETTGGVPYLSSLPVIGAAFGNQGYDKTATQLLVVITGTVVQ